MRSAALKPLVSSVDVWTCPLSDLHYSGPRCSRFPSANATPLEQCDIERVCGKLLEQIGLVAEDTREHRLKLEPSRHRTSNLLPRRNRGGRIDLYRHAGRLGEQLRLATAVHGDEPPRRFLDGLPDGEQSMIPQNCRFVLSERLRDARALRRFVHHAGKVREQSVVLVKRASVLRDGIEQPPERRPRFPVHRMRVRRRNHLGTRRVHLRVDGKRRSVDGMLSLDHVAAVIHQNQVGRANLPEVHPERVHPEVVEPFRIARRDVPRYAFIESETRKEPEGRGQHPLAMQALLCGRGKLRRPRNVQYIGGCSRHLDLRLAHRTPPPVPSTTNLGGWPTISWGRLQASNQRMNQSQRPHAQKWRTEHPATMIAVRCSVVSLTL